MDIRFSEEIISRCSPAPAAGVFHIHMKYGITSSSIFHGISITFERQGVARSLISLLLSVLEKIHEKISPLSLSLWNTRRGKDWKSFYSRKKAPPFERTTKLLVSAKGRSYVFLSNARKNRASLGLCEERKRKGDSSSGSTIVEWDFLEETK